MSESLCAATLQFESSALLEHAKILETKLALVGAEHEFGARLSNFREHQFWRELPMEPPLTDFIDYVRRCVDVSVSQAYKYMDAAYFPAWTVQKHGVEKMAQLRKIVALTAAEETAEEAVAMVLPIAPGQTKPFEEATVKEVRQAREILKAGQAGIERPAPAPSPVTEEARSLESQAEAAVAEWLAPEQVTARTRKGEVLLDLKGIRRSDARKIFETLARILPES
jgi:hypothetical protein